jgi:hypothetical protein
MLIAIIVDVDVAQPGFIHQFPERFDADLAVAKPPEQFVQTLILRDTNGANVASFIALQDASPVADERATISVAID